MNKLNIDQRILYSALMMPVNQIPSFPESTEVIALGQQIKKLYQDKVFTKMYLDTEGIVKCV